jgi:hypothetical protein
MQRISTILYSIWIARNDREFNGKHLPPTEMVNRALKNLLEFQAHTKALGFQLLNLGKTVTTLAGVFPPRHPQTQFGCWTGLWPKKE